MRNNVADVIHTGEVHNKALKAKTKARVCARAVTTKIQVILVIVGVHAKLNNALLQKLKTVFSL